MKKLWIPAALAACRMLRCSMPARSAGAVGVPRTASPAATSRPRGRSSGRGSTARPTSRSRSGQRRAARAEGVPGQDEDLGGAGLHGQDRRDRPAAGHAVLVPLQARTTDVERRSGRSRRRPTSSTPANVKFTYTGDSDGTKVGGVNRVQQLRDARRARGTRTATSSSTSATRSTRTRASGRVARRPRWPSTATPTSEQSHLPEPDEPAGSRRRRTR